MHTYSVYDISFKNLNIEICWGQTMNAFSLENQVLYNSKICPANKKNIQK